MEVWRQRPSKSYQYQRKLIVNYVTKVYISPILKTNTIDVN